MSAIDRASLFAPDAWRDASWECHIEFLDGDEGRRMSWLGEPS